MFSTKMVESNVRSTSKDRCVSQNTEFRERLVEAGQHQIWTAHEQLLLQKDEVQDDLWEMVRGAIFRTVNGVGEEVALESMLCSDETSHADAYYLERVNPENVMNVRPTYLVSCLYCLGSLEEVLVLC